MPYKLVKQPISNCWMNLALVVGAIILFSLLTKPFTHRKKQAKQNIRYTQMYLPYA